LANILSNKYKGFGETMENCSIDLQKKKLTVQINRKKSFNIGYCCLDKTILDRVYWSIYGSILTDTGSSVNSSSSSSSSSQNSSNISK
ncbi:unnamed protein product, partial [Schistosoma turkestanicum]